jgi:hypothetical protein
MARKIQARISGDGGRPEEMISISIRKGTDYLLKNVPEACIIVHGNNLVYLAGGIICHFWHFSC